MVAPCAHLLHRLTLARLEAHEGVSGCCALPPVPADRLLECPRTPVVQVALVGGADLALVRPRHAARHASRPRAAPHPTPQPEQTLSPRCSQVALELQRERGAEAFGEALRSNTSLTVLDLSNTGLDAATKRLLDQAQLAAAEPAVTIDVSGVKLDDMAC